MNLSRTALAVLSLLYSTAVMADALPLEQRIDAALAPMFKADAPGATVIVTQDGKPLFRKAYGQASVDAKTPMQPDMQLRVGSMTKQFTAVAILMLADQGKLSLQDDVTRFLPDYPTKGKRITIENLIHHTSGIRNYTNMGAFWSIADEDKTVDQMIDFFKNEPMDFAPGERWGYSNSGYFLLGAIIEKASGMRYADFIAKNIFEPLDMHDTAYEGHERSARRRIAGHNKGFFSGFKEVNAISMSLPYAAGAIVSTVDDLARWDAAITAGKLLKPETWKQAFVPCSLPKDAHCVYGYGWNIGKLRGHKAIAHGGDIPGFNADAVRLPDEKIYVAVLSNVNRDVVNTSMAAQLAAAIAVGNPFPEQKVVKLAPADLEGLVGTYKVADGNIRSISRKGDKLSWDRDGRPSLTLTPYAMDGFYLGGTLTTVEFRRGADGVAKGFTMHQGIGDMSAERVAK